MPANTKVRVLLNSAPIVGASVWVGEIGGNLKTTDEDGCVSLPNVPAGFEGYTEVCVEYQDVFATAKIILKYGETTTVDLGEREE